MPDGAENIQISQSLAVIDRSHPKKYRHHDDYFDHPIGHFFALANAAANALPMPEGVVLVAGARFFDPEFSLRGFL